MVAMRQTQIELIVVVDMTHKNSVRLRFTDYVANASTLAPAASITSSSLSLCISVLGMWARRRQQ